MLRKIIVEQVAAMMVLPNKLPIKLSDAVASNTLKFPEPEVSQYYIHTLYFYFLLILLT